MKTLLNLQHSNGIGSAGKLLCSALLALLCLSTQAAAKTVRLGHINTATRRVSDVL